MFLLDANYESSNSNSNIGARLLLLTILFKTIVRPAAWQKNNWRDKPSNIVERFISNISIKNCTEAIYNASHKKKKRKMVKHILDNIDKYAKELSEGLQNKTFLTPYTHKVISDGLSGKVRELEIPNFYPDQCAHHAIMQV